METSELSGFKFLMFKQIETDAAFSFLASR